MSYNDWPKDQDDRWIAAGHTFGRYLMRCARDYAFEQIPADLTPAARDAAKAAALNAIYGVLMMLDGVVQEDLDEQDCD